MIGHPPLCVCPACGTRRETAARTEIAQLKGLVRELLAALQTWADAKESLELDDLCERAKKASAVTQRGGGR